jgi:inner membrane protein
MDNVTHTLYGYALAKAGFGRVSKYATAAILIGANFPDIDLASIAWGQINYLKYHRGPTHSLAGVVIQSFCVTLLVLLFDRARNRRLSFQSLAGLNLAFLIGMGSHVLLDYTNSYGIRPYWPFSGSWHSLDLVFIIDPWILTFFLFGLGLAHLFRLINQEIGAHSNSIQGGAIACLILISSYWTVKAISHRSALQELETQPYVSGQPVSLGAFPQFLNPFGWYGIIETSKAFHMKFVGWTPLPQTRTSITARSFYKPNQTEILQAISKGTQAQTFMNFARYPFPQILPNENGYEVEVRDLRFEFASKFRKGFRYRAELDSQLNILTEQFRF